MSETLVGPPAVRSSAASALPTLAMAAATGMGVANIYYNQPMLGLIERDMPGPLSAMLPMVTQLGYALGLVLLVPLGDLLERRRLIVVQFLALAVALGLLAAAPDAGLLLVAAAAVGALSTVAQQIVPFAAHLASPEKRGAVVGTVMSGLLAGILLSRTLAGVISAHAGWRAMFVLAVPVALLAGGLMRWRLPRSQPEAGLGYGALLISMEKLWREFADLRISAITQALIFGAFSAFWSMLALHLQEPRYGLGAATAGLFGVIGLVGVGAAPLAGRVADRHGPRPMIVAGALTVLGGWLILRLWDTLAGMVVGVILLDFGVQIALISNQHIVYALRPEARSRLNTVFMSVMFLGGALGSAGAAWGWEHAGWAGVALIGLAASGGAAAVQLIFARKIRG
ncbi:MFS transporter [Novosphingobium sp.]|uniref:MFS transporter n=1 Tax=Novosphingobium sp. TaxID=1874826 RepID=UPI0031E1A0CA